MVFLRLVTIIPSIYIFFSIGLLFVFGCVFTYSSAQRYPNIYITLTYLSVVILVSTLVLLLNNAMHYQASPTSGGIVQNSSVLILEVFILLASILILVVITRYNNKYNVHSLEYLILLLFSIGCLMIFIKLLNLIYIYLFLEIQSIAVSILISANRTNRYSIEASIKYFILGSYSSLLFLFGTSLLYGSTGLVTINSMAQFLEYFELIQNEVVLTSTKLALLLILIGMLFKVYSAPFHFWLADIYEGTPTSVLIYLSSIHLIAMLFFFIKLYLNIFFDVLRLKILIVTLMALLTMSLGAIGAVFQNKLKQLLSHSTITVTGFFLYSITQVNMIVLEYNIFYILLYIVLSMAFLILILNVFNNNALVSKVTDIYNLYTVNTIVSLLFIIVIFTFTGLPPFILFISKLFWIKTFLYEYCVGIIALLLCLLLSTFYYLRIIKNVFITLESNKGLILFKGYYYEAIWILWIIVFMLSSYFITNTKVLIYIQLLLFPILNEL